MSAEHHHHHHHGAAEANREYFDAHAHEQVDNEEFRALASQCATAILSQVSLSSASVLDFACGTGNLSRSLLPHCSRILGVDISPESVSLYNRLSPDTTRMSAMCRDLAREPLGGEDAFDAVVCSMSCHHLESPEKMAEVLARLVRSGGCLVVVDFAEGAGISVEQLKGVDERLREAIPHHAGFSEERLRKMFVDVAGLKDFSIADAGPFTYKGAKNSRLVVARGIKP